MRFAADYDSEEEEFPVDDVSCEFYPGASSDYFTFASTDEDSEDDYVDLSIYYSLKPKHDAWLAMYNRDEEISRLNTLNAHSMSKTFRNSLLVEDLEAVSVADFLKELSIHDEGRQRTADEEVRRRNADILETIAKAINATKTRQETHRKAEEEMRRMQKLEQERLRKLELENQERERIRLERLASEQARKAEEERAAAAKKLEEERVEREKKAAERPVPVPSAPLSQSPLSDPQTEFNKHLATIENIKSTVLKACSENPVWKKACFELKRKITSRLGQLTNSRRQISRLVKDLLEVFDKGQTVDPMVLMWLLNFFSKQVIKQAESEVVVQTPSAYPLAFDILLARFAKNCPWTVPYYENPTTTEEVMKRMGYQRTEDGKWEEITRYIERQSGIFAVWIAMTTHQLNPKALTHEADVQPFPMANAWRWVARTLNHPATNEIECAMMATFLEVGNQDFLRMYKRQAQKIVNLAVSAQWIGGIRGPAAGRLEIMRDEFHRTGRIGEEGFGAFVP